MNTIIKLLNNKWFYISVILILLFVLFSGIREPRTLVTTITKTDTVYINRPYKKIVIKEIIKPQKVYVYKRDTVFREKIIHDTLFTALLLKDNKAKIHTLTPLGIPNINEYTLPDFNALTIDYKGRLDIKPTKHPNRKRTWNTIKHVGIFVGGVLIGSQLNKS